MIIRQPNSNLLLQGDCIKILKELPDNSVDAVITDPPYGLGFMGKQWDTFDKSQFGKQGDEGENDLKVKKNFKILPRYNSDGLYDFTKDWAKECLRVLKPGGYLLSFSGTRTYHKICMGIEDAGFEIRDMISWLYGSGFPKSYNIGKGINKLLTQGSASWNGTGDSSKGGLGYAKMQHQQGYRDKDYSNKHQDKTEITEERAKEWEGWGTALKPACEPIVVARKPLSEKNVASNVLKWGTGGINIDACRVETNPEVDDMLRTVDRNKRESETWEKGSGFKNENNSLTGVRPEGRFPANIILDEEAGKILDEQSGIGKSKKTMRGVGLTGSEVYGKGDLKYDTERGHNDKVGASRFFYCAKAGKKERNLGCEELGEKPVDIQQPHNSKDLEERYNMTSKNNHPTVKPIKLMEYLVKLVSKEGATVLDPFLGSGTTAIACLKLERNWIGIEREEDYIKIIKARIKPFEESSPKSRSGNK